MVLKCKRSLEQGAAEKKKNDYLNIKFRKYFSCTLYDVVWFPVEELISPILRDTIFVDEK